MNREAKIYIAGHKGLVGSAIIRRLIELGYTNLIYRDHNELDLTRQECVENFFNKEKPDYVFLVAAKVGGILANLKYPADFIINNLLIQCNVIKASYTNSVKKLIFTGSSCIYPKECIQPIKEDYLLSGPLEETNEAYAIAKISGIKTCEYYKKQYEADFISAMPCNIYGIGDNFHKENSHVIPALINKFHEAKAKCLDDVVIWGSGNPKREFLFSDDLADGLIYLMNNYDGTKFVNIGFGKDISIRDLAILISEIVGFKGNIIYDTSKPDGTKNKLLDISTIKELGWSPKTNLIEGLRLVYDWYSKGALA